MPSAHREHQGWSPDVFLLWASEVGISTLEVTKRNLSKHNHPEKSYRTHLGLKHLCKTYGNERLEKACQQSLAIGAPYHSNIKSILKNKLEQCAVVYHEEKPRGSVKHNNVRGAHYYKQ